MIPQSFRNHFGISPDVHAEAPGRVNLIGEHTDYSGGFVMPMAIPQRTRVDLARRADRTARVVSVNVARGETTFEVGEEQRTGDWVDYVKGAVRALREAGYPVTGFDAMVASDVPLGSGLSSSAALEVAILRALRDAFGLDVDDVSIARIARVAENDFVGAPVGIMDQMAASLADEHTALFLDTRSLTFERLPLPPTAEIIVVDSGVTHEHVSGHYRVRRQECEQAASLLGVTELRDASDLVRIDRLPAPLARRARHVVTENGRVVQAAAAMRRGDANALGVLFNASHASLRDDFEVSVPDVDRLVALACSDERVFGARMTGGGFGGAIVALVQHGQGSDAARRLVAAYDSGGARRGRVFVPIGKTNEVADVG